MDFENVCIECSKTFETNDSEMNYCPECWAKIINNTLESDCIQIESENSDE